MFMTEKKRYLTDLHIEKCQNQKFAYEQQVRLLFCWLLYERYNNQQCVEAYTVSTR